MPPDDEGALVNPQTAGSGPDSRFDVFLSHNSKDKPTVERIARALQKHGIEPWLDVWHLTPGGDWQREIAEGLRRSGACAVFVGEADLGDWEQQELGLALDRAAKTPRFRVFPVLLPGIPEPFDAHRLPPFLSTRTWVDFRGGYSDERTLQRLIKAIKGIPLGAQEEPEARPGISPYRGLQVFEEEHAEFFFGRDADVQRLVELLKTDRFLAVLGPSGSGKSSLVRAGLVPAIRRGALPVSDDWKVAVLKPGAEPLTGLAAHLLDLFPAGAIHDTVDRLEADERTLHLAVGQGMLRTPEEQRTVLVVDQFEEVFTLCRDEDQRRAFIANLLHAGLNPSGRTVAVITMRADFYPKCSLYPGLAQAVSANQFLAWPIEEWALAQAIEEPARLVGLELEEGLTDQILADLRDAPGTLPLMEHALLELWERRRGNMLALEAYRQIGGVEGALARRADEVYASLSPTEQTIARSVLLRLTQPGEGTEDTRRRASMSELAGRTEERESVEHVVGAMTDARLLTAGTEAESSEQWVDVSHEALIRGWPRLRGWLEEDRTGLRTHRRLTEAAQDWQRTERDPDALYRGARLAEAREWAERNPVALNELEEEFLRESAEAEERARRSRVRRLRVTAGALAAGLIVVAGLAVVAFLQRGRADEQERLARSRELAATSLEQIERDPQLSLLLAIEAYETAPTAQAEAAIRGALVSSPLRKVLDVGAPASVDMSPDGKLIATQTVFGEVALWDLASGRRLKVLQAGAKPEGTEFPGFEGPPVETVSFSPDGKLLFAGVDEGSFSPEGKPLSLGKASGRIWSVPDGRPALRLEGAFYSGGWAPDGSALLTVGLPKLVEGPPEGSSGSPEAPPEGSPKGQEGAGIVRLWDTSTGGVRADFRREEGDDPFTIALLSPDGRLVAIEDGGEVHVKSASTGRTVGVFEGRLFLHHPFSADGRLLVLSGPEFERARVFDVASGRLVRDLRPGSGVYDAALSPDGSRVVTGQIVGGRIWEVKSGRFVELSGHAGAIVRAAFSLDGSRVLTLSEDSQGRVWDAETGRVLAVLAGGSIGSASLTPDGRSVVTSGGDEARIWEVGGAAALVFRGHEAPVVSARFSPDGHSVISSDVGGGTARIWVAETGAQTSVLRPRELPGDELLLHAEFSADGKQAVTSGLRLGPAESEAEQVPAALWDLATETVRREFHPLAGPLGGCKSFEGCTFEDAALSPDGTRLATAGGDGILRIWDVEEGSALETIRVSRKTFGPEDIPFLVSGVEWAPDGMKVIALSGDGFLHLFDATTLRRIRRFGADAGGGPISSLNPDLSRNGSLVAVGYPDGTVRVWETATGRLVAELPHAGPVYDVGFSSEGSFLVTASGDAATIWDLESQRPLTQLFGHRAAVLSVDFSPAGSSIVSGSEDETVRIWRCEVCAPIDQLLDLARERALRDLTPAERARFLHEG
jgi:WD40 repeat protein